MKHRFLYAAYVLVVVLLSLAPLSSVVAAKLFKKGLRVNSIIRVPGDYPTIGEAVGNASDGDIIVVDEGVYNESITINGFSSLTIVANGTVVINAWGRPYGLRIYNSMDVNITGLKVINASNPFEVIGGSSDIYLYKVRACYGDKLVYVESSDNVYIGKSVFRYGNYSVYSVTSSIMIDSSRIESPVYIVASIADIEHNIIDSSSINIYYAAVLPDSFMRPRTFISLLEIYANTFTSGEIYEADSVAQYIYMYQTLGVMVSNNMFIGGGNGVVVNQSSSIYIYGNVFNYTVTPVYAVGSTQLRVESNNITTATVGMVLHGVYDSLIMRNYIVWTDIGIELSRSVDVLIYSNTINRSNTYGVYSYKSRYIWLYYNIIVSYNIGLLDMESNRTEIELLFAFGYYNGYGIYLYRSLNATIENSLAITFWNGIQIWRSENTYLSSVYSELNMHDGIAIWLSNNITIWYAVALNNSAGIHIYGSSNINITGTEYEEPEISSRYTGVIIDRSVNVTLYAVELSGNLYGAIVLDSENILFTRTLIYNNTNGILALRSDKMTINLSWFTDNIVAVVLFFIENATIYLNNFISNNYELVAVSSTTRLYSPAPITYIYNGTAYTNYLGNYWDKQTPREDSDNDGITDTQYATPLGIDEYPLYKSIEFYNI